MKETPLNEWRFSQDEEYWGDSDSYPTRDEAIEKAEWFYDNQKYLIGREYGLDFTLDDCEWLDLGDKAVEGLIDILDKEIGDADEHWSNKITAEDEEELNKLLARTVMDWINSKMTSPHFYMISDIESLGGY